MRILILMQRSPNDEIKCSIPFPCIRGRVLVSHQRLSCRNDVRAIVYGLSLILARGVSHVGSIGVLLSDLSLGSPLLAGSRGGGFRGVAAITVAVLVAA